MFEDWKHSVSCLDMCFSRRSLFHLLFGGFIIHNLKYLVLASKPPVGYASVSFSIYYEWLISFQIWAWRNILLLEVGHHSRVSVRFLSYCPLLSFPFGCLFSQYQPFLSLCRQLHYRAVSPSSVSNAHKCPGGRILITHWRETRRWHFINDLRWQQIRQPSFSPHIAINF